MQKYEKYVNALFVLVAALIWLVSSHYTSVIIGYFQLGRKFGTGVDVLQHAVPILLGVAVFFALRAYPLTNNFVSDSVGELIRVVWPTGKEVRLGTIVVIATVIIAGLTLGALDVFLSALIKAFLGT